MKKLILFSIFILIFKLQIFAKDNCFVVLENKTDFPSNLISAMTTSIISQFVKKVEQVPISGLDDSANDCLYEVNFQKSGDTTFLVLNGPNLNAYGDSKLEGADAAQQALLKALYRSIPTQQFKICELYDEFITKCDDLKQIEVASGSEKIEKNVTEKNNDDSIITSYHHKKDYFKILGGFFSTTTYLNATDYYSQYNTNTAFEESVNGSGILGIVYRYFIEENISLDAAYSISPVNSIEYEDVQNSSSNIDYSPQNNISGNIVTLHFLVNYNWLGGNDSWMGNNWSIFLGGGYGSTAANYTYEKDVILINEKYYTNTLNVSGFSLSFGFDYTFNNNFVAGLYYASANGTPNGTRVDDLTTFGYQVNAYNSLVNFSLGYNFR